MKERISDKPAPKLFISYSWSTKEHEEWTLRLATELREGGVDVIMDKWDLREGNDAFKFMEQMVADASICKVIMVCDRKYKEKADERIGGVGAETQIITPEIYEKAEQDKFVAVIAECDEGGKPFIPTYYRNRLYIDLSDQEKYDRNFEQLLRWAHDRPLYSKPPLGRTPVALANPDTLSLGTSQFSRRALDAIRNNKEHRLGALREYTERLAGNFEYMRLSDAEGEEIGKRVIESIEAFLPYRDEAIDVFSTTAKYCSSADSADYSSTLHRLFEQLLPYLDRPATVTRWRETDFDNFRFIIHELFLYCVGGLIKSDRFDVIHHLARQNYYVSSGDISDTGMTPFYSFSMPVDSLSRPPNRRVDLLKDRATNREIDFSLLMQADIVLFMIDCIEALGEGRENWWWPETLVYASPRGLVPLEIFARAQSMTYFNKLAVALGIARKEDLVPVFEAVEKGRLRCPRSGPFGGRILASLMNYDRLATKP